MQGVMAHLITGKPAPWEYMILYLCRDVFHCTPSQLAREDMGLINRLLVCIQAEGGVRSSRGAKRTGKR